MLKMPRLYCMRRPTYSSPTLGDHGIVGLQIMLDADDHVAACGEQVGEERILGVLDGVAVAQDRDRQFDHVRHRFHLAVAADGDVDGDGAVAAQGIDEGQRPVMDRPFARGEIERRWPARKYARTIKPRFIFDLQYGLVQCGQGFEKMIGAAGRRRCPAACGLYRRVLLQPDDCHDRDRSQAIERPKAHGNQTAGGEGASQKRLEEEVCDASHRNGSATGARRKEVQWRR